MFLATVNFISIEFYVLTHFQKICMKPLDNHILNKNWDIYYHMVNPFLTDL